MQTISQPEVSIDRMHEFHSKTPVIKVPAGTLKLRDMVWREQRGMNHGSSAIKIENAGAWNAVAEIVKRYYATEKGYPAGEFTALFYIVEECGKTSCGCLTVRNSAGIISFCG